LESVGLAALDAEAEPLELSDEPELVVDELSPDFSDFLVSDEPAPVDGVPDSLLRAFFRDSEG
jgi:hypothetical protein